MILILIKIKTMKLLSKNIILLLLCFAAFFTSCKKDNSGAKVGVDEGKISTDSESNETFTIIDIKTEVFGDTTSVAVESVNKDSTKYFYFGFENVINFGEKTYTITDPDDESSTSIVYAYVRIGAGSKLTTIPYSAGTITILKYVEKSELQGSFEFLLPSIESDSVNIKTLKGEFFASYSLLDPNRVPNLPISPQTMEVTINSVKTLLNAAGGPNAAEDAKGYIINGTLGSDVAVTLSFKYFIPQVNQVYKIGDTIVIENDMGIVEDNDTGYIEASYFAKGVTYLANSERGSGKALRH